MTTTGSLTVRILVVLLAVCALLFAVRAIAPTGSVEWLDYLMLAGYVSVLFAHQVGVPGVLEHNGLCGWGMCAPTPVGWAIAVVFWLFSLTLLSWLIAWLFTRNSRVRT
jgi:hypothetical protein